MYLNEQRTRDRPGRAEPSRAEPMPLYFLATASCAVVVVVPVFFIACAQAISSNFLLFLSFARNKNDPYFLPCPSLLIISSSLIIALRLIDSRPLLFGKTIERTFGAANRRHCCMWFSFSPSVFLSLSLSLSFLLILLRSSSLLLHSLLLPSGNVRFIGLDSLSVLFSYRRRA